MGFLKKHIWKLLVSVVLTASLLYMLKKEDFSLIPARSSFASLHVWAIPVYFAMNGLTTYFRAMRWRFLLRPFAEVPRKRLLAVSFIGFGAILLLPFRIGEFVRPMMIREPNRISLSTATSTVVAERVVDGLVLSIMLALGLWLVPTHQPLPVSVIGLPSISLSQVRASATVILLVFVTAFIVIAVFYFARVGARKLTLAVVGLVSMKLAEKLAGTAEKLADGLRFLGEPKNALPFLAETLIYWFSNAAGMWFLAWGCGVTHADGSAPTYGEAIAIMGMLGATVLIPGPPGLLGLFHVGIACGMSFYYPAESVLGPGACYTFLLYVIQLVWTVSAASWGLSDKKSREGLAQATDASDDPESAAKPAA
jgi:glycosyltransferase 2 family protein